MKKTVLKTLTFLMVCAFTLFLSSCGGEGKSTLFFANDIAAVFPMKYGTVYSDEFSIQDEYYFSAAMKERIFGKNAGKYTYIISVSGYFSRDMVSGSEFIAVIIDDRSHRAELASVFYRRAAMKTDMTTRVFCDDNYVFFICDERANEIIEYIKTKI